MERYETSTVDEKVELAVSVELAEVRQELTGVGNGPIDAVASAVNRAHRR